MAHEGPFEMLMSAVAILGLIVLVASIFWVIYRIIDKAFLKEHSGQGTIVGKRLARPHTTVTMQSHSARYENSWRLTISIDDHDGEISIGQGSIGQFQVGDQVLATYSIGRFSRDIHLFNITRKETKDDHETP